MPESERASIEEGEWEKHGALPEVPNKPIDLAG